jgi:hypothetical protein
MRRKLTRLKNKLKIKRERNEKLKKEEKIRQKMRGRNEEICNLRKKDVREEQEKVTTECQKEAKER